MLEYYRNVRSMHFEIYELGATNHPRRTHFILSIMGRELKCSTENDPSSQLLNLYSVYRIFDLQHPYIVKLIGWQDNSSVYQCCICKCIYYKTPVWWKLETDSE